MDYTAVGQTTHLAARMEQLAAPGSIRLAAATSQLAEGFIQVAPLGPVPIKGLGEPIQVYELVGASAARTRLEATARRGLTRFVGRNKELEQLRDALDRASGGHGQVVAVVGEAGVGKSRLVYELTHSHRMQGWLILESASVPYGKATSYLPVIDLLKGYFKIQDRDDLREIREKVTGKLLTLDRALEPTLPALLALLDLTADDPKRQTSDPVERRQRTLDAVKRLLLREAREQPLLVIFEDLQWIDGETQAVLDTSPAQDPAHPEEGVSRVFSLRPLARHDLPERVDAYSSEKQLAPHASSCLLAYVIEGVNALALDSAKPNAPIPGQRLEQEVLCEHRRPSALLTHAPSVAMVQSRAMTSDCCARRTA
jgi:AAA ATPase domain